MTRQLSLCALIVVAVAALWSAASAQDLRAVEVTACPGVEDTAPDFSGPDCQTTTHWRVDPQGRHLWLKAELPVSQALLQSEQPIGVFVSAKASSEVFLNGVRIGQNGVPALIKARETPGTMDAVFYAPREIVREGANELILRMSSHHGFLHFGYPVHGIAIDAYRNPTRVILNAYWPSLITFGAFIAGALYYAASAVNNRRSIDMGLLALVSVFAAAQLFTEASRGLTPYAYPAHEWRMILILLFSLGFGLCLLAHVLAKFARKQAVAGFAGGVAATLCGIVLVTGFDAKAALAILIPAGLSALAAGIAAVRREPQAAIYVGTLALFCGTVIAFPTLFLDAVFFYEVAALLLVLFVAQANALARERRQREEETVRARQLSLALEQAQRRQSPEQIKINAAGKIDLIAAEDIAYCKGAGDYVELKLKDGRDILHHASLAQLEKELPATFLRVHRSYLVNTALVDALTRESSGTGALHLSNGAEVPVSRRIMPKVRSALA
ncbi:MAG: LytR/AlgR family response regulator transcription factor [Hyphococcus sp.]